MEKKELVEKALNMVRRSYKPSTANTKIGECERYSTDDHDRYIKGHMSTRDTHNFENHCEDCSPCLQGILQSHQRFAKEEDQAENETLFRKTLNFLNSLETQDSGNIMSIVVRKLGKVLEVISTTGELLEIPAATPTRGEDDSFPGERSIRLLQEFEDPPISIQASLEAGIAEQEVDLEISLFDMQGHEFMRGIEVLVTGPGDEQKSTTSESGGATIVIGRAGDYQVRFESGGEQLARLTISLTSG